MTINFPSLYVKRQMFVMTNSAQSGGLSTAGGEQFIESGSGLWEATLDVILNGASQWLAWEAFVADMRGSFNEALVPYNQWQRAPWPVDDYGRELAPWVTRRKELDGSEFEDPEIPDESEINATLAAASIGATSVVITVTQGSALSAGLMFDSGNRIHRIAAITSVAGTAYTCRVYPELRRAYSNGDLVELVRPRCIMRFSDNVQGVPTDDGLSKAIVSVKFRESL